MTPVAPGPDELRAWLRDALVAEGHEADLEEEAVVLGSGLCLDAEFGDPEVLADGDVRIVTRTLAWHAAFPDGLLEYQHACGPDVRAAVLSGFTQWSRLDLPALEDAIPGEEQQCLHMTMAIPERDGAPPRRRRVVHGPTARWVADGAAQAEDPDHPFCPCCMPQAIFEALQPVLMDDAPHGVRLFAIRNADGSVEADCRIDGEDFPEGAEALREYAAGWPGSGAEFRKQYLVVRTLGDDEGGPDR